MKEMMKQYLKNDRFLNLTIHITTSHIEIIILRTMKILLKKTVRRGLKTTDSLDDFKTLEQN